VISPDGREAISRSIFRLGIPLTTSEADDIQFGIRTVEGCWRNVLDGTNCGRSRSNLNFLQYLRQRNPVIPTEPLRREPNKIDPRFQSHGKTVHHLWNFSPLTAMRVTAKPFIT